MYYLLAAYTVTLLVLGLAAWRLRSGLAGAEADLAALGPDAGGPTFGGEKRTISERTAAERSSEDAEPPSST